MKMSKQEQIGQNKQNEQNEFIFDHFGQTSYTPTLTTLQRRVIAIKTENSITKYITNYFKLCNWVKKPIFNY